MKNILAVLLAIFPVGVLAHTRYVISEDVPLPVYGITDSFSPLLDPWNLILICIVFGAVLLLYSVAQKLDFIKHKLDRIDSRIAAYQHLVPWILRISLGILLLGSATHDVLVSPVAHISGFSGIQTVVGFCLLAGFLLTPMTLAALILYLYAVSTDSYLLGNFEVFGALLATLAFANPSPGVDDLFGIPQLAIKWLQQHSTTILRIGIGIAFLYLGIYEKFLHPELSFAVVQKYNLTSLIPVSAGMWVMSAGIIEALLGICFILGFKTRLCAAIAFVVLATTFFGLREDVVAHVTLFGSISSLFILGSGWFSLDYYLERRYHKVQSRVIRT